jgi:hypothetical protein
MASAWNSEEASESALSGGVGMVNQFPDMCGGGEAAVHAVGSSMG